ncbi:MAG: hypothetical protein C0425_06325 [Chlorobiaceae bacterium]|nr:hypothetical protein [Chlorobiaceae bacterium]MBA4309936.1 hypothetical protein [Chlorobiaceae bacterium]
MKYFGLGAGIVFFILGFVVLFSNILADHLPAQFKVMMGIVLIMYGLYRIISTLTRIKMEKRDADKENDKIIQS